MKNIDIMTAKVDTKVIITQNGTGTYNRGKGLSICKVGVSPSQKKCLIVVYSTLDNNKRFLFHSGQHNTIILPDNLDKLPDYKNLKIGDKIIFNNGSLVTGIIDRKTKKRCYVGKNYIDEKSQFFLVRND